jgi:predicted extracellular nuclease
LGQFGFDTPLGETVYSLAEGDSVVVTGEVMEYYGKTEITNVTDVTVHGPAIYPFEPLDVTVDQIMTDGTESEAYEGMLVRVSNVIVDEEDLVAGPCTVTSVTFVISVFP